MEASHRPKQAQHFSTCRKVQNGNSTVHQDFPDSGEWVSSIDLSDTYLHLPIHPLSRKYLRFCHRSQVFQFTSLPFGLATGPPGLHNDYETGEADGPHQRSQTSPIPGRLAYQIPVSGGSPSKHSGSGRSNSIPGVDYKSGKVGTKTYSGVFVRGLRIPSRFSPCKTHSREMAQTPGFDPTTQVKTCFDCKMFDVANWVASLNGEDGPVGTPSHEALSVSPQGALEISSVAGQPPSLDRNDFCTPRLVAKSCQCDEGRRPSSQRPQYPTVYRRLKRRLGHSLGTKFYSRSVVRTGKKATHKCSRIEGGLTGPSSVQGPVSEPNSFSCHGQLKSSSLHKQTRRNSLSGDVCTPVEDHDLVPSLPHNIESQAHSRLSQRDGRPPVQVPPSSVDRMVFTSTGVQANLPKVVHPSCRPVSHSSEPQTPSIRVSYPRPTGLGHRCSEHKLDWSYCLCLPSNGSPLQGDPKNQAMLLPDHSNSPRLARDALVLGPCAALNRDPATTSSVNNTTQTVPQLRISQQSATSQPPHLVSRSGQLQEQGFSVEVAERIAAPQRSSRRTVYKSKWALFEKW